MRLNFKNILILMLTVCLMSGCVQTIKHNPLSVAEYKQLHPADAGGSIRWWGDILPLNFKEGLKREAKKLRKLYPEAIHAKLENAPVRILLSISGGGADGAFTAGILDGWSASGERPKFDFVTGVSTGAIIAPFAYLGSDYDGVILDIYGSITRDSIYEFDFLMGLLYGSALTNTDPLKKRIERYITPKLISEIAKENHKERKLYIITTHLDAMRPMVWDIGAIAAWNNAKAIQLIRKIILASSAIPVLFPPVPIEWKHNGKTYTELHVDGGVTRNVFSYPTQINLKESKVMQGLTFRRKIYVIQNGNSRITYKPSATGITDIATRSLLGLLQTRSNADIEHIYYLAKRDGVEFNMIEIPDSFVANKAMEFDMDYMQNLIQLGRKIASQKNFWHQKPSSERK